MVFLFEGAREFAVLYAADHPRMHVLRELVDTNGFVRAQGSWKRTDGGSDLSPSAVVISCSQEKSQCVEATTTAYTGDNFVPALNTYPATFTPGLVTCANDDPYCFHYTVRLDLTMNRVTAVRQRVSNPSNPMCNELEPKIEMALGHGIDFERNELKGHFVPLMNVLAWVLRTVGL